MASLVPEEDDWHPRDCSSPIDYASTTVRIQALRGRTFVELVATADVRALPMKSGSSSTLNERGAITKDTMCAEHFSEKCEENTCQVTGVACVPNGFPNFETKLVMLGGDTDSDVLRGSRVLCAPRGPRAFSAVSRLPPSTGYVKRRFRSTFSWVPMKDVKCLSWQCGHRISDSFEIFEPFWRALHTRPEARLVVLDERDILHLESDNSYYEYDAVKDTAPFGAGLIWVIGKGRCDVNSKNPFVGSERGLTQIDSRTKATAQVSEETGNGDDKNHCIEFVGSKLGTTFPDVAMDRAFNVLKKLIGKGTGKKDRQAPRWALAKFLILVMKISGYLATRIVRCRMVDRYKVCVTVSLLSDDFVGCSLKTLSRHQNLRY